MAVLRGHTDRVTSVDFAPSGAFLASASLGEQQYSVQACQHSPTTTDRSVRVWDVGSFAAKQHSYQRFNVPLDHARHVCASPDSKFTVLNLARDPSILAVRVSRVRCESCSPSVLISHGSPMTDPRFVRGDAVSTCKSPSVGFPRHCFKGTIHGHVRFFWKAQGQSMPLTQGTCEAALTMCS